MNIWIFNQYATKPNEAGGTRHYDFGRQFVKHGHNVHIIASSFAHYTFTWRERYFYTENVEGVMFHWIWTWPYKGNSIWRMINMLSYFFISIIRALMIKPKPDVIVGSSVHLFACLAAYVVSVFRKSAYVVEIRDLWPRTLIDMGAIHEQSFLAKLFFSIERFVYKKADCIITLLPGSIKYIADVCGMKEKIVYIPNGIVVREENGKSSVESRLKEIKKNHKQIVMYVGAHGYANAIDVILESVYFTKSDVAYVFIGDGPEKQKLMDRASKMENVYFLNPIPKKDVVATLKHADVLVISMRNSPIYKYGISLNKLSDYLLSGKPILFAGRVYNDVVTDAKVGITIEPENPSEMAKGIERLLTLDELQKKEIEQRSRAYVNENYNIERLAMLFLHVCLKMKGERKR